MRSLPNDLVSNPTLGGAHALSPNGGRAFSFRRGGKFVEELNHLITKRLGPKANLFDYLP
jgi:hypothetical protein